MCGNVYGESMENTEAQPFVLNALLIDEVGY